MPEYVRVKQVETGHELSVPREHYDATSDGYELLEKPSADAAGDPLPLKPHKPLARRRQANPASDTGQQATTDKKGA